MDNPAYILENILPKSTFVFLFITLMKWIWPYIKEEYQKRYFYKYIYLNDNTEKAIMVYLRDYIFGNKNTLYDNKMGAKITEYGVWYKNIFIVRKDKELCFRSFDKAELDKFVADIQLNCLNDNKTCIQQYVKGIVNNCYDTVYTYAMSIFKLHHDIIIQQIYDIEYLGSKFYMDLIYDEDAKKDYGKILRFWSDSNDVVKTFLRNSSIQQNNKPQILTHSQGGWNLSEMNITKSLETVFLPKYEKQLLKKDVDNFMIDKKLYETFGLKYQRGYLFYGIPGTGKTSTIKALCGYLNLDVYIFNVSQIDGYDQFMNLVTKINQNKLHAIVFEDIDCINLKRKDIKNQLTFDIILNFIDGVQESQNRIIFMTTNYVEKLDSALIRPGRIDLKIKFTYCDEDQFSQMYKMIFNEELPPIAFKHNTFTTSYLMNLCLQNRQTKHVVLDKVQ